MVTFTLGVLGTAIGLLFVDDSVKSLFDEFIKVIGLFMGVLGGLFTLGILTRRVNGRSALIASLSSFAIVIAIAWFTPINGYLFALIGIVSCVAIGLLLSLITPKNNRDLTGLTIYTVEKNNLVFPIFHDCHNWNDTGWAAKGMAHP